MASARERQQAWAASEGIPHERGYCQSPEANLPWLTDAIRGEVSAGDGNEFGGPGQPARIAALHSSAALGVNFFGYWKSRGNGPLRSALRLASPIDRIVFERKFPTGVGPRSPNMDVTLELAGGASLLAIESKFTEWLGTSGSKPLRDAYLSLGKKRWEAVGLPGAQAAAETYLREPCFSHLDVPQLLKHMLGLGSQAADWQLLLLWYDQPGAESAEMRSQVERFKRLLGSDAGRFEASTYQELWPALAENLGKADTAYGAYITKRYFPEATLIEAPPPPGDR